MHWASWTHAVPSAPAAGEAGSCVGGAGVGCGAGGVCVEPVGCVPCCIGGGGCGGGGDDETKQAAMNIVAISNSLTRMAASYTSRDG